MSSFFDKPTGIKFKAQIRVGAGIGQDHHYFNWPDAAHPRSAGGKVSPDLVFDAELKDRYFDLRRPGYGAKSDYGNGSIFVDRLDDLIVAPEDRQRVVQYFVDQKKKQIDKAYDDLGKLHAELSALQRSERKDGAA